MSGWAPCFSLLFLLEIDPQFCIFRNLILSDHALLELSHRDGKQSIFILVSWWELYLIKRMEMYQFKWSRHSGLSRKIPVGEEMRSEGGYWMVLRSLFCVSPGMPSAPCQNVNFTQGRTCLSCSVVHLQHLEQSEVLNTYLINGWIGGWLAG